MEKVYQPVTHSLRKIIRIEHADGYGIHMSNPKSWARYTIGECKNTQMTLDLHCSELNVPYVDGINLHFNMFCAFVTVDIMLNLSPIEELQWLLSNHDFKVFEIEVSKYVIGTSGKQICFYKEDIVSKKDITNQFI